MLVFLSMFIGAFLVVLGLVTIYLGIRTYIRLCSAKLAIGGDVVSTYHLFLTHGLTEADTPIYNSARPFFTLVSMFIIGLLPLSFGVLLFVRVIGIF